MFSFYQVLDLLPKLKITNPTEVMVTSGQFNIRSHHSSLCPRVRFIFFFTVDYEQPEMTVGPRHYYWNLRFGRPPYWTAREHRVAEAASVG